MWACQWLSPQPLSSSQFSHNDSLWALGISKNHREKGLDYREAEELCWCPSWTNSLWQRWSCELMYCPGGNGTDPIWRVLASSDGISSWTPLKPQHNRLANQLWCIDVFTPPTPLIVPHRLPSFLPWISYATQKLMLDSCKMVEKQKHSIRFCAIFPSLKHNFIVYRSSKVSSRPACIFEIHQLWQSGFSRVYSNCCCSCLFEPEIIKIGQSSHKMYSNKYWIFKIVRQF